MRLHVLLVSIALAGTAEAQAVLNGSFEFPGYPAPPYHRFVPSESTLTNWTLTGTGAGEQSYLVDVSAGSPYSPVFVTDGTRALRLSYGDTITQTISGLNVGTTYEILFDMQSKDLPLGSGGLAPLSVSVGGASYDFFNEGSGLSLLFVAMDISAELSFYANSPETDNSVKGVVIDAVRMSMIPESATYTKIYAMASLFFVLCVRKGRRYCV